MYKGDKEANRKIIEELMEMENIEQKQLIRLGKREEYKIRTILVKLYIIYIYKRDEETTIDVLVRAKSLDFQRKAQGYLCRKIWVDKIQKEKRTWEWN